MAQFNFQGHPQWAIVEEPQRTYTVYNKSKFEILGQKTPMDYYLDGDKWTWSPVSYTHLDVYKRQAIRLLMALSVGWATACSW